MRPALLVFILVAVSSPKLHAAFSHPSTSPALAACGGTLASRDYTAGMILRTPASVCMSHGISIEFAGQRLYSLSQLDSYIAAAAFRHGKWGAGAAVLSMGDPDLYMESTLTGCVGFAAMKCLKLGVSVSYNRADMGSTYASVSSPSSGCGIILIPSSHWRLHLSMSNPLEPPLLGETRLRRETSAGITVTGFENASFAVETTSRSGDRARCRLGEVYRVSSTLFLSAGVVTSPFVPSFGCRFSWKHFNLLYAYRYHPQLGGTHLWGIAMSRH